MRRRAKPVSMKKSIFKMLVLVFFGTIAALSLAIGGMFLFGGFDEKPVYASDLEFNSTRRISSRTFFLQVNTQSKDINQNILKLEVSMGGERVINFPKYVKIGEPFSIMPKVDPVTKANIGGCAHLTARYEDPHSNQSLVATCDIMIDVPVRDLSCKSNGVSVNVKIADRLSFAKIGQPLSDVFSINPSNSLLPYIEGKDVFFGSASPDSFMKKKIFLRLYDAKTNLLDSEKSQFEVDHRSSFPANTIEVPYKYDSGKGTFVFAGNIDIVPKEKEGEIYVRPFVVSTYEDQRSRNIGLTNFSDYTSSGGKESILIQQYTIDSITTNLTSGDVYYKEQTPLYINNPSHTSGIDLGIELHNQHGHPINNYMYVHNIYISVCNGSDFNLFKQDRSTSGEESGSGINVYYNDISLLDSDKDRWAWQFQYNDFNCFYKYKKESTNENKIKLKIVYDDGTGGVLAPIFVYLIPQIREVSGITVNYLGGQQDFSVSGGSIFKLSDEMLNIEYVDGKHRISTVEYYIPFSTNTISTLPNISGSYDISFSFVPKKSGNLTDITLLPGVKFNKQTKIDFEQKVGNDEPLRQTWQCSESGSITEKAHDITFEADVPIVVRTGITTPGDITTMTGSIFNITFAGENIGIDVSDILFFHMVSGAELPYLWLNGGNVEYQVDYDFYRYYYEPGDSLYNPQDPNLYAKFIHIKMGGNSIYRANGLGKFNILAQVVYKGEGGSDIYWFKHNGNLSQATINVNVYENLVELQVYKLNLDDNRIYPFSSQNTDEYDENTETPLYIFVTSPNINALKTNNNYNKLNLEFIQHFSVSGLNQINEDDYEGIRDINKNTIELSNTWTYKSNIQYGSSTIEGYYTSYKIGQFYSIKTSGVDIKVDFETKISMRGLMDVPVKFFYSSNDQGSLDPYLFSIKDNIFTYVKFKYGDGEVGKTVEVPINLTAQHVSGQANIAWGVAGASFGDPRYNVSYGFYHSEEEVSQTGFIFSKLNVSDMKYEISCLPDSNGNIPVNYINSFCKFEIEEDGKGGLTFENVPYVEGGILVEIKVKAEVPNDNNSYFVFDEQTKHFVQRVNDSILKGASLYFKLTGLNLLIEVRTNNFPYGEQDRNINLFYIDQNSVDPIFNIFLVGAGSPTPLRTNMQNDYSELFNLQFITNSADLDCKLSKNEIIVKRHLLEDCKATFKFYYKNLDNVLNIKVGDNFKESYIQTFASNFSVETETMFKSPSEDKALIKGIKYRDGTEVELGGDQKVLNCWISEYSVEGKREQDDYDYVTRNGDLFDFAVVSKPFRINFTITLERIDDPDGTNNPQTYIDKQAVVSPIYDESELDFPESLVAGQSLSQNLTITGENLSGQLGIDKGKGNITGITVSNFEDDKDREPYPVVALDHMSATNNIESNMTPGKLPLSISSGDLNFEKYIKVTLEVHFVKNGNPNGIFEITKELHIIPNLEISFSSNLATPIKSGDVINMGATHDTYEVKRNGEKNTDLLQHIQDSLDNLSQGGDFTVTPDGDSEAYFKTTNTIGSNIWEVQYATGHQGNPENDTVTAHVVLTYHVKYSGRSYNLVFTLPIDLLLKESE